MVFLNNFIVIIYLYCNSLTVISILNSNLQTYLNAIPLFCEVLGIGTCLSTVTTQKVSIEPWFVTAASHFTDAEGSFNVSVSRSSSTKIGWRVQMRFIIELHKKDLALLTSIQSFFNGIGTIINSITKDVVRFSVVDQIQIINVILPHFNKYPLQSAKLIDFQESVLI